MLNEQEISIIAEALVKNGLCKDSEYAKAQLIQDASSVSLPSHNPASAGSFLSLLTLLYRYRTMNNPREGTFSDEWSSALMIQLATPYLSDKSSLLAHLMPQIVRIEGFENELIQQSRPHPEVLEPEIQKTQKQDISR